MSTRRKPNSGDPRDPEKMTERMVNAALVFAKELVIACSVPAPYAIEYVNTMLTTEIDRQCASCGALHQDINSLAYFCQAETNTTVLWAQCDSCTTIQAEGTDQARNLLDATAAETLLRWANRALEPEGVVIIFTFAPPKVKPDPISIDEIAPVEEEES